MKAKFTTYQEIDEAIEIAKMQREIHYRKLLFSVSNIKSDIEPSNIIKNGLSKVFKFGSFFSGSKSIKSIVISYLVRFVIKRILRKK